MYVVTSKVSVSNLICVHLPTAMRMRKHVRTNKKSGKKLKLNFMIRNFYADLITVESGLNKNPGNSSIYNQNQTKTSLSKQV